MSIWTRLHIKAPVWYWNWNCIWRAVTITRAILYYLLRADVFRISTDQSSFSYCLNSRMDWAQLTEVANSLVKEKNRYIRAAMTVVDVGKNHKWFGNLGWFCLTYMIVDFLWENIGYSDKIFSMDCGPVQAISKSMRMMGEMNSLWICCVIILTTVTRLTSLHQYAIFWKARYYSPRQIKGDTQHEQCVFA